jgi:hypothetical protein
MNMGQSAAWDGKRKAESVKSKSTAHPDIYRARFTPLFETLSLFVILSRTS